MVPLWSDGAPWYYIPSGQITLWASSSNPTCSSLPLNPLTLETWLFYPSWIKSTEVSIVILTGWWVPMIAQEWKDCFSWLEWFSRPCNQAHQLVQRGAENCRRRRLSIGFRGRPNFCLLPFDEIFFSTNSNNLFQNLSFRMLLRVFTWFNPLDNSHHICSKVSKFPVDPDNKLNIYLLSLPSIKFLFSFWGRVSKLLLLRFVIWFLTKHYFVVQGRGGGQLNVKR